MAHHRHKRETNARRMPRSPAALALGRIAVLVTPRRRARCPGRRPPTADDLVAASAYRAPRRLSLSASTAADRLACPVDLALRDNKDAVKRGPRRRRAGRHGDRGPPGKNQALDDRRRSTCGRPGDEGRQVGEIKAGAGPRHRAPGPRPRRDRPRGQGRWVTDGYLERGSPRRHRRRSDGAVPHSGGAHLRHRRRPPPSAPPSRQISTYGTLRGGGGDHALGRAVDIMVSASLGSAVADFVRAHYAELGVST